MSRNPLRTTHLKMIFKTPESRVMTNFYPPVFGIPEQSAVSSYQERLIRQKSESWLLSSTGFHWAAHFDLQRLRKLQISNAALGFEE
jgi:hypothetical protein